MDDLKYRSICHEHDKRLCRRPRLDRRGLLFRMASALDELLPLKKNDRRGWPSQLRRPAPGAYPLAHFIQQPSAKAIEGWSILSKYLLYRASSRMGPFHSIYQQMMFQVWYMARCYCCRSLKETPMILNLSMGSSLMTLLLGICCAQPPAKSWFFHTFEQYLA